MELKGNRVYTVAFISGSREAFAFEDMSKMAAAGSASNFDAFHTPSFVLMPAHGTWNGIKEGRPSTTTIELGSALVKGRSAACTSVDAGVVVFIILSCTGGLSAFLAEYSELLWRESGPPF